MPKGKFIVLEGIDGSGKTTQAKNLGNFFEKTGINHLLTKEPTDSSLGRLARAALLMEENFCPEALGLLFAADRADHIKREIFPALEAGALVLCDRYVYSNMAFQGTAIPQKHIAAYHEGFLVYPDLTLFIDADPEESTKRLSTRTSPELYDDLQVSHEVRRQYFNAFKLMGHKMPVTQINGNLKEDEVFKLLKAAVMPFCNPC